MPELLRNATRSAKSAVKVRALAVPALITALPPNTRAAATARISAIVSTSAAVNAPWVPKAAMKLTSDSGCFRWSARSAQLMYGLSWLSPVDAYISRRASFKVGMPVSRPRARFRAGKSSGRPSRLLRKASVTNSSISLPTWRVTPRMIAPAASSAVAPLPANASGLRKAAIRPSCESGLFGSVSSGLNAGSKRSTVSVNIE
ncbi:hypothetical protein BSF40_50270 [Pseudomonas sp. ACN5]|nr:hypothetical protein BSF40_50270 [Pseudomonas sp. ACN5]